jgi:hypothetical protein
MIKPHTLPLLLSKPTYCQAHIYSSAAKAHRRHFRRETPVCKPPQARVPEYLPTQPNRQEHAERIFEEKGGEEEGEGGTTGSTIRVIKWSGQNSIDV